MSRNGSPSKQESKHVYIETRLPVGELTIDPRVQRTNLNLAKVMRIVNNYNPAVLGVMTISSRRDRSNVILDGMHRVEAVRRLTDNQGDVPCHVFTDLTLMEEATTFLDLNGGDKPTVIDTYRISVIAGDLIACRIDKLVHAYGYTVDGVQANGHINAVKTLRKIVQLSDKVEADPDLLQLTLVVIGRAWGNDKYGVQAPMLLGVARLLAEYGARLDVDRLIDRLRHYKGGPQALLVAASTQAAQRRVPGAMAVADIATDEYMRGPAPKAAYAIPRWSKRV